MSFLQSKKIKWQKEREEKWAKEYSANELAFNKKLSEFQSNFDTIRRKQLDLEDLERRVSDRKLELEKENEELKQQIRIAEAKSKPDVIWVNAFNEGFSKAWDMMIPIMKDGIDKLRDSIRTEAIDSTLDGLESTIVKRIDKAGLIQLKPTNELIYKKQSFESKLHQTKDPMEKAKYQNYIDTLDWILNGNLSKEN